MAPIEGTLQPWVSLCLVLEAAGILSGCGVTPAPASTGGAGCDRAGRDRRSRRRIADSALLLSWTAPGDDGDDGQALRYEIRFSTLPATVPGWADSLANLVPGPSPGPAGADERWVIHGLMPDSTYFVRVWSIDDSENRSPASNVASAAVGDRIPPAPISDLAVTQITTTRASLRWSASGDDGLRGRATRTELRMHSAPITAENWNATTLVLDLTDPADPGAPETFTVTGLVATSTYYFAARAVDDAGLLSPLASALRLDTPTIVVRSVGGATTGYPSLRAALTAVQANESVQLGAGTFDGPDNRDLEPAGVSITVRGAGADANGTVLDLEGQGRAFYFRHASDTGSVVQHLLIRNGFAGPTAPGFGGAIFCFGGASPTLVDCTFEDNTAVAQGGAVSARNGSAPFLSQCTFRRNRSGTDGGALGADTVSRPRVLDSAFEENEAVDRGGAIALIGDSGGEIQNCTFRDNTAGHHGGALAAVTSSPEVLGCVFESNTAGEGGGAILCRESANPTIDRCTMRDNSALRWGGAVYCWIASSPILTRCVLESNEAEQGGGLLAWTSSFPSISQSTLVLNRACFGSAVRCIGSASGASISRSILALGGIPECAEGAGLAVHLQNDAQVQIDCTAIFGNVGGDWVRWLEGLQDVNGNLAADPRFCDPEGRDFRLRQDSPCLDSAECRLIGALSGCGSLSVSRRHPRVPEPMLVPGERVRAD
ncbi:MAG: right-handed parallel beta-helix repeat-containing protein [Candidatus Eisenbacteria bacterium]